MKVPSVDDVLNASQFLRWLFFFRFRTTLIVLGSWFFNGYDIKTISISASWPVNITAEAALDQTRRVKKLIRPSSTVVIRN